MANDQAEALPDIASEPATEWVNRWTAKDMALDKSGGLVVVGQTYTQSDKYPTKAAAEAEARRYMRDFAVVQKTLSYAGAFPTGEDR